MAGEQNKLQCTDNSVLKLSILVTCSFICGSVTQVDVEYFSLICALNLLKQTSFCTKKQTFPYQVFIM